jgi:AcrR family transcriptional regulator
MGPALPAGADRKAEILERAAVLFARDGVASTPLSEIASAVGIKKGSLYYFFESKEALLLEVIRPVVEGPARELEAIVDGPGHAVFRLTEAMAALGRQFDIHPGRMEILIRERLDRHLSSEASEEVRRWKAAYTDFWRRLLRGGAAEGVFGPLDDKLTAFAHIGALNWMYAWFDPRGDLSGEEIGRRSARQFLTGLLADPATAGTPHRQDSSPDVVPLPNRAARTRRPRP